MYFSTTYYPQPYLLADGLPPVVHGSKKDLTTVRQPMLEFPLGWITRDENNAPWGLLKLCPFKFVYNSYTFARTHSPIYKHIHLETGLKWKKIFIYINRFLSLTKKTETVWILHVLKSRWIFFNYCS